MVGTTIAGSMSKPRTRPHRTVRSVVFLRAVYVPTVLALGRFQCPCDRVSLPSKEIHRRIGNLSVGVGTSVPCGTDGRSDRRCLMLSGSRSAFVRRVFINVGQLPG